MDAMINQVTPRKSTNMAMTQPSVIDVNPYTTEESLAVARLIWALLCSDQQISLNESNYFQQSLEYLGLTKPAFDRYLIVDEEKAYETVKAMSSTKRSHCATLLRLAYQSDQTVNSISLSTLNSMLTKAELFRSDTFKPKRHDEGHII